MKKTISKFLDKLTLIKLLVAAFVIGSFFAANGAMAAGISITTTSLPNGTVGSAYSQTLAATGGTAPFTWSANPSLPDGLLLDPSSGNITGTPTTAGGPTSITFSIIDTASPSNSGSAIIPITIDAASVTKTDQTITFGALSNKSYPTSDFNVSATASSKLTVTFTAAGDCTVSGATVHPTGGGSCTITAQQAGDSTYNAAPDVSRTFNINNPTLLNPSFEINSNGLPANWTSDTWGTNTTTFNYPVTGADGSSTKAAQVTISAYPTTDTTVGGDSKWSFDNVTITPGGYYSFSDKYMSTTNSIVVVQFHNTDNTLSYQQIGTPIAASTWTPFSAGFIVPLGVNSLTVFHLINSVGTLTVDDYSLAQTTNPNAFSKGMVSLSFDDDWQSIYDNAVPAMNAAGFKSTQYVINNTVGDTADGYMTQAEVTALYNAGNDITSHTMDHLDLVGLAAPQLQYQIWNGRADILNTYGAPADDFAYPLGLYDAPSEAVIQGSGYLGARTVNPGYNDKSTNRMLLLQQSVERGGSCVTELGTVDNPPPTSLAQIENWIDTAIATKTWLILTFHQIDNVTANCYGSDTAQFQSIVTYLKSKTNTNSVNVVTVSQGLHMMPNVPTTGDKTPPVITAATNITVPATSASGATVTFTAPAVTDNLDTTLTAQCNSAPGTSTGLVSGSVFPVGTTTVTCDAADSSGNLATPVSFTITVGAPSSNKAITAFSIAGTAGTINETNHTIAVNVPSGTAVTSLVPTITMTGSSISPLATVAEDFTNPVVYTVTAADNSTQAYTVTVTVGAATFAVNSVSLNEHSATLTVGSTDQLVATVSPSNATVSTVTWSSSNAPVATVSSTGLVTAVSAGSATITATTTDGSHTDTDVITVNNSVPVSTGGGGGSYYGGGGGGSSLSLIQNPATNTVPAVTTITSSTPSVGRVLGASTFFFAKDLKYSMTNQDVTELQKILISKGFLSGQSTGFFGKLTLAAVKKYQKNYKIPTTGMVGPLTRRQLNSETNQASTGAGSNDEAILALQQKISELKANIALFMQNPGK